MRRGKRITNEEFRNTWPVSQEIFTSYIEIADWPNYLCVSCDRPFWTKGPVFYDLCDPCFSRWNTRNITSRLNGGPHNVPIEKHMDRWPLWPKEDLIVPKE